MSHRRKVLLQLISNSSQNQNLDGNWIFHNTVNIDTGEVTWFIFHNTKNCSLSNQQTTIVSGQTYTTEIIADTGKDITKLQLVVMYNGQDISSTCYDPVTHIITINNVQHNIDIHAKIQGVPAEYTQYDWLQSSGTQYILLNYIPNTNTAINITFKTLTIPVNSDAACIFVARNNWEYNSFAFFYRKSSGKFTFHGDEKQYGTYLANTNYNFICNLGQSSGTLTNLDAVSSITNSLGTQKDSLTNLTLFGLAGNSGYRINIQIKSFIILENSTHVLELYPAVRNSDSKPGMYDIVNDIFYTNSGTGEFTYGND